MARRRVDIWIDDEVWKGVQEIAESVGLSSSRYVEILLRANAKSRGPVRDAVTGLVKELVQVEKEVRKTRKKKK